MSFDVPSVARPRSGRPGARRRRLRRVVLLTALVMPVAVAAGVELGGLAVVRSAVHDAKTQMDAGDFVAAEAGFRAVGDRTGAAYLLAGSAIRDARLDVQRTDIAWARALKDQGRVDDAIAAAARVTDPTLAVDARATAADAALAAARAAEAGAHWDEALARLDELTTLNPSSTQASAAVSIRSDVVVKQTMQLVAGGQARRAVSAIDALAGNTGTPPDVISRATALLPAALLRAGTDALAAHDPATARPFLSRLEADAPATPEAAQAHALLSAAQPVTGVLVRPDGSPAAAVMVRLGAHYRTTAGGFATDPPYYSARTTTHGDFSIPGVPVGSDLVLQYFDGGWSVRTDRSGQPLDRVAVAPLSPVDLGFVIEPA